MMRQPEQAVAAEEGDVRAPECVARGVEEDSDPRVLSVTFTATRKAFQMTDDTWDAVVTSTGKGTFLIRRRDDHLSRPCPLLWYDVRSIEPVRYDRQRVRAERGGESDAPSGDHRSAVGMDASTEP